MAKKSVAAEADLVGGNDRKVESDKAVKFVSNRQEFHFMLTEQDSDGKQVFHTDADGNNKIKSYKQYSFVKVAGHKDPKTGKVDPSTAFSFFIVDPTVHGREYNRILDHLNKMRSNPLYQMFNDDEHFNQRNPEAYRIAKEKVELQETVAAKDARIAELEKKLGFNK